MIGLENLDLMFKKLTLSRFQQNKKVKKNNFLISVFLKCLHKPQLLQINFKIQILLNNDQKEAVDVMSRDLSCDIYEIMKVKGLNLHPGLSAQ